jgi:hypothetical protein
MKFKIAITENVILIIGLVVGVLPCCEDRLIMA